MPVIEVQTAQRFVDGKLGALEAGVLDPELAGDEQFFARHTRAAQAFSYGLFIFVRRSSVDQAVSGLDRIDDAALARVRIRNLENAKAQNGHPATVVQSDLFHGCPAESVCAEL